MTFYLLGFISTGNNPFIFLNQTDRVEVIQIDEATDGTATKAAKLKWAPVAKARNYVVTIKADGVRDDFVTGTNTSLEFHYHTLVMEKAKEKPEEIVVRVEVFALDDDKVKGKTSKPQKLSKLTYVNNDNNNARMAPHWGFSAL